MNESRFVAAVRHWSVALLVVGLAFGLAMLLVLRLSTTLTHVPGVAGSLPGDGHVALGSSLEERGALFDRRVLEPGESIQACLAIEATTDGVNRGVTLDMLRPGIQDHPLAQRLQLTVERGTGTFATSNLAGECRGFHATELLLSDTLAGVVGRDQVPVWRPPSGEAEAHFRFTARLPSTVSPDLVGAEIDDVTLMFETVAEVGEPAWIDRSSLLLSGLAQNRSAPVLALVVLALFFSSLQALLSGDRRWEQETTSEDRGFQPPSLA